MRWNQIGISAVAGVFFMASSAFAIPDLNSGKPGCLKMILERPMAERIAMKLEPNCRALRSAYLSSLEWYAKDPARFQKEISGAIQKNKGSKSAYWAILMAALFEEEKALPALKTRAQVEEKKGFSPPFAQAALERIQKKQCSEKFSAQIYDEVCRMSSPAAQRIVDLSGSYPGATR